MKCASVNRTLLRPFSFLKQIAKSSDDSGFARVHDVGGERNRSQLRQNDTEANVIEVSMEGQKRAMRRTLFGDSFRDINTRKCIGRYRMR